MTVLLRRQRVVRPTTGPYGSEKNIEREHCLGVARVRVVVMICTSHGTSAPGLTSLNVANVTAQNGPLSDQYFSVQARGLFVSRTIRRNGSLAAFRMDLDRGKVWLVQAVHGISAFKRPGFLLTDPIPALRTIAQCHGNGNR